MTNAFLFVLLSVGFFVAWQAFRLANETWFTVSYRVRRGTTMEGGLMSVMALSDHDAVRKVERAEAPEHVFVVSVRRG